jgi:hypothetical protein
LPQNNQKKRTLLVTNLYFFIIKSFCFSEEKEAGHSASVEEGEPQVKKARLEMM